MGPISYTAEALPNISTLRLYITLTESKSKLDGATAVHARLEGTPGKQELVLKQQIDLSTQGKKNEIFEASEVCEVFKLPANCEVDRENILVMPRRDYLEVKLRLLSLEGRLTSDPECGVAESHQVRHDVEALLARMKEDAAPVFLCCKNCSAPLSSAPLRDVLELPSSEWHELAEQWFCSGCCGGGDRAMALVHTLQRHLQLTPGKCLVGPYSLVVPAGDLRPAALRHAAGHGPFASATGVVDSRGKQVEEEQEEEQEEEEEEEKRGQQEPEHRQAREQQQEEQQQKEQRQGEEQEEEDQEQRLVTAAFGKLWLEPSFPQAAPGPALGPAPGSGPGPELPSGAHPAVAHAPADPPHLSPHPHSHSHPHHACQQHQHQHQHQQANEQMSRRGSSRPPGGGGATWREGEAAPAPAPSSLPQPPNFAPGAGTWRALECRCSAVVGAWLSPDSNGGADSRGSAESGARVEGGGGCVESSAESAKRGGGWAGSGGGSAESGGAGEGGEGGGAEEDVGGSGGRAGRAACADSAKSAGSGGRVERSGRAKSAKTAGRVKFAGSGGRVENGEHGGAGVGRATSADTAAGIDGGGMRGALAGGGSVHLWRHRVTVSGGGGGNDPNYAVAAAAAEVAVAVATAGGGGEGGSSLRPREALASHTLPSLLASQLLLAHGERACHLAVVRDVNTRAPRLKLRLLGGSHVWVAPGSTSCSSTGRGCSSSSGSSSSSAGGSIGSKGSRGKSEGAGDGPNGIALSKRDPPPEDGRLSGEGGPAPAEGGREPQQQQQQERMLLRPFIKCLFEDAGDDCRSVDTWGEQQQAEDVHLLEGEIDTLSTSLLHSSRQFPESCRRFQQFAVSLLPV